MSLISSFYEFHLHGVPRTCGYIPEWVVQKMPWNSGWTVDYERHHIEPSSQFTTVEEQNELIAKTLDTARREGSFQVLKRWRNELNPAGGSRHSQIGIERSGGPLFGIVTYGVHMTAYVKVQDDIKIWVPRRARKKQTYGGMLDNTVAGGIGTNEEPLECLVREAAEEASFPEDLVRFAAKACGTVTYFFIRDERAGGESGLLQPEVQYVYDMQVSPSTIPRPCDDEVEEFYLWSIEEVKSALAEGQFKPNCAVVLLDFFVRHGILTAENEEQYIEIVSRIHRKLPLAAA